MSPRKSLAFFSVFHPHRMGIADYSDDLVAELKHHLDVTCYVADGQAPDQVREHAGVRPHGEFQGREDLNLFQIGNMGDLSFLLPHLLKHGGAITLHDACQYDLTYPFFRTRPVRFAMEIVRSLEPEARRLLLRRPWTPQRVVQTYLTHPDRRRHFRFTRFILRAASRVIVHSDHLERHVAALTPGLATHVIPLGVRPAPGATRAEARARLARRHGVSVNPATAVFLSFGAIQPHKRITPVLQAFGAFCREHADALYLFVGPRDPEYDLDADLARFGVRDRVRIWDAYLPDEDVDTCIQACDLAFNLRWPDLGSSSSALHRIFAGGRPAAVTRAGSFAEYSDRIALEIPPPPGEAEWQRCLDAMRLVRDDPDRVAAMGEQARAFVTEQCAWPRVAERYARALGAAP